MAKKNIRALSLCIEHSNLDSTLQIWDIQCSRRSNKRKCYFGSTLSPDKKAEADEI